MPKANSLHVVAGPTASGKTAYAIQLAEKIGGELVNADSRQIYKYLDIGTNKGDIRQTGTEKLSNDLDIKEFPIFELENSGVSIHLLSFLEPDQRFSAYEYQQLVFQLLPQIWAQGKTAILVGGTGLYIDFVLNPERYGSGGVLSTTQWDNLPKQELQVRLEDLAPEVYASMNDSDRENPRRLVSRLRNLSSEKKALSGPAVGRPAIQDIRIHYITKPLPELSERINARVVQMFQQGLVAEVQKVLDLGYLPGVIALQGIGYKEVSRLLAGKIDKVECIKLIQIAHRQYAKRQITWFKKYLPSGGYPPPEVPAHLPLL